MSLCFIDTNIIVYANDSRNQEKQYQALDIIVGHIKSKTGVVSTQVLQEYANVALTKLHQNQAVVLRQLVLLEELHIVQQTPCLIRRGIEIQSSYQINFWDALIISAAESAKCKIILSEDMNAGQFYSGIAMQNPFISQKS